MKTGILEVLRLEAVAYRIESVNKQGQELKKGLCYIRVQSVYTIVRWMKPDVFYRIQCSTDTKKSYQVHGHEI